MPALFTAVSSPLALLFFLAGHPWLLQRCEAGCRQAGLCCPGRDPACVGRGWRADRSYGTCYCDQACASTMDCCHDYQLACPAVSCVVSEWTQWSGCSEPCRASVRRRSRTVRQEPLNGGKPCPVLEETAGCVEYRPQPPHCSNALVPALITTGGYGNARKKRDIPDSDDVIGYCVQFQLLSLTAGCQWSLGPHTQWMQYLREGHHVCVECQAPALAAGHTHCSGDGEPEQQDDHGRRSLQWQAIGNPRCRGVWRRVGRLDSCSCPTVHSFLFI